VSIGLTGRGLGFVAGLRGAQPQLRPDLTGPPTGAAATSRTLVRGADPEKVTSRDSLANPEALDAFHRARNDILAALGLPLGPA
jgi:hypothetical protein